MEVQVTSYLILFSISVSSIHVQNITKCCKSEEVIFDYNRTLSCNTTTSRRFQNNFKNIDFISKNISGNCIEIYSPDKISIFSVNKLKIIEKVPDVEYFPKCCPLGSVYNESSHGCAPSNHSKYFGSVLKADTFIKIGLIECDIIFDRILSSSESFEIRQEEIKLKETGQKFGKGQFCLDQTVGGKTVVRTCEKMKICDRVRCINKCCPDGQSYINGSNCHDTFIHGVELHMWDGIVNPDEPFAITHGILKPIFLMRGNNFSIDNKGVLTVYNSRAKTHSSYRPRDRKYCIEYVNIKKKLMDNYMMFGGRAVPELEMKLAVTRWVKLTSCIFLILTIAVYLILPRMRNLFGKILLSYSGATLWYFALLTFTQFETNLSDSQCKITGYLSVLTGIWSFTWMHIMCIDIWLSFGNARTLVGPLQKNELKQFLHYSVYGWGFPIVWTLIIYVFNVTAVLPKVIHPIVGINRCYLQQYEEETGSYAYIAFITLPLLIQQIVNTIMFVKTIRYCLRIKAEIRRMNENTLKKKEFNSDKERLELIIKLALVMGVTFLFETISSIYNFQNNPITTIIEVIGDSINCSQGVFIFIIFICKRKIFVEIRNKLLQLNSRKESVTSNTTQMSLQQVGGSKSDYSSVDTK